MLRFSRYLCQVKPLRTVSHRHGIDPFIKQLGCCISDSSENPVPEGT